MGTAAAIIGGSVIGGGLSLLGSKKQSDAAKKASKRSAGTQLEMFYQTRADQAPWREAGERALGELETQTQTLADVIQDPSMFVKSPAYDFLYQQGIDALDRSAAARGKLDSGQHSQDLMRYGQGYASAGYDNYLNRLQLLLNRYSGTAGIGQTSANLMAGLGQRTAENVAQAQAGGIIGQANATTGLYNNLSNIGSNAVNQYMLNNYLQNMGNQSAPTMIPSTAAPAFGNVSTIRGGQGGGYGF